MRRDHAKLICDVSELTGLFHDAPSMEDFLNKITCLIAEHMACEVCSIYFYYEDANELVLKCTRGLNPAYVGQVRMRPGEGLTGLAFQEKRAICEGQVRQNPNFRLFPGLGEERFESLLAVPILRGSNEIGVMVVQSEKRNYFTTEDVQIFRAITAQLATTIETARLLITLNDQKKLREPSVLPPGLRFIKGLTGAEGVAFAETMVIDESAADIERFVASGRSYSKDDLRRAIAQSEQQLQELQNHIEASFFDVAGLIFTAQILMLKDKGFTEAILMQVEKGLDPSHAVVHVVKEYARKFEAITDTYLRDKIYDIKDVGRRVLENMTGMTNHQRDISGRIVIAQELLPSDALKLFTQQAKGIILLSGGASSHVSILARSLNLPLVVADQQGLCNLPAGTKVLLDGVMGHIHLQPTDEIVRKIIDREDLNKNIDRLKKLIRPHPKTKDGVPVKLMANVNLLGDLKAANEFRADGIGLYRTEFPFLIRNSFPSEEEQYFIYRKLLEGMPGKEVTFRTLDIGGDKILTYYDYGKEENPFLGLRSIRFSLKHRDVFVQQIRAVLRAGKGHKIRILFPMICSLDEFIEAKGIVQESVHELALEKVPHHSSPPLGIMIELPSVLEIIDDLAQDADFFSIGTNDLIQYLLAVDRTNEKVADLYLPQHPSVLRSLKKVVDAAKKFGKDVSICGDMASQPMYLPLLLGMGLRNFSMDARYLPKLHETLQQISVEQAEQLTQAVLKECKVFRTTELLEKFLKT